MILARYLLEVGSANQRPPTLIDQTKLQLSTGSLLRLTDPQALLHDTITRQHEAA